MQYGIWHAIFWLQMIPTVHSAFNTAECGIQPEKTKTKKGTKRANDNLLWEVLANMGDKLYF